MQRLIFLIWYKLPKLTLIPFLPLSILFLISIYIRKFLLINIFNRYTSKHKIIIVGNLVVGGSGKTPFTIWLSNYLKEKGKETIIVSSGYGSSISSPKVITEISDPTQVGDESVLLSSKTRSMIVASSNRVESTKYCDENKTDFIIHDDGLQHYSLNRDYEFIIINKNMRDNKFLLPCGPNREPKFFHKKSDFIFSNYKGTQYPGFYSEIAGVKSHIDNKTYNLDDNRFSQSILLTAIADNLSIIEELQSYGIDLNTLSYPDHYQFNESDIPSADLPILVTEKDFVKIRSFANKNIYILEQKTIPNDKLLKLVEKLL